MLKSRQTKAQSTLEYAVLIVLVAMALLATQTYVKRAMQGRLRSAADDMGEQFSPGASKVTTNTDSSTVTTERSLDGESSSVISGNDTTSRISSTEIDAFNSTGEFWLQGCGDNYCDEAAGETYRNCPADCDIP